MLRKQQLRKFIGRTLFTNNYQQMKTLFKTEQSKPKRRKKTSKGAEVNENIGRNNILQKVKGKVKIKVARQTKKKELTNYGTSYALPLFFLCIKTNVDYCVVGSFVVQRETRRAIAEALSVLRKVESDVVSQVFHDRFQ